MIIHIQYIKYNILHILYIIYHWPYIIDHVLHTHRCMYGGFIWLLRGGSGSPQWLSLNHIRTTETVSLVDWTNARFSAFPSSDSLLCPRSCNRRLSILPVCVLLVDNSWERLLAFTDLLLDRPARWLSLIMSTGSFWFTQFRHMHVRAFILLHMQCNHHFLPALWLFTDRWRHWSTDGSSLTTTSLSVTEHLQGGKMI